MQLADYVIRDRGHELPLSMPEPGPACEHHGGSHSFGVPAWDLAFAQELCGKTARLFTAQGMPVGRLAVKHVDPELCVLSGDLRPNGGDRRRSSRLRRWLHGLLARWRASRGPRRPRSARN